MSATACLASDVDSIRAELTEAVTAFNQNEAAACCPVARLLAIDKIQSLRRALKKAIAAAQRPQP